MSSSCSAWRRPGASCSGFSAKWKIFFSFIKEAKNEQVSRSGSHRRSRRPGRLRQERARTGSRTRTGSRRCSRSGSGPRCRRFGSRCCSGRRSCCCSRSPREEVIFASDQKAAFGRLFCFLGPCGGPASLSRSAQSNPPKPLLTTAPANRLQATAPASGAPARWRPGSLAPPRGGCRPAGASGAHRGRWPAGIRR